MGLHLWVASLGWSPGSTLGLVYFCLAASLFSLSWNQTDQRIPQSSVPKFLHLRLRCALFFRATKEHRIPKKVWRVWPPIWNNWPYGGRFELKAEGRKNVERVRAKSKLGEKKTGQTLYCLVSCDVKEPQNNHFQEYVIFFAHNAFVWRFRTNTCFRDPSYTFLHEQINTDYLEMSEQWWNRSSMKGRHLTNQK